MSWTWICHGYVWQHIVYQYVARELKPRCGKLGLRYRSRVGNCRKERERESQRQSKRDRERYLHPLFFSFILFLSFYHTMSFTIPINQADPTAPTPQNTPLTHAPLTAGLSRPTVPDITEDNEDDEDDSPNVPISGTTGLQQAMLGLVQNRLQNLVGKSSGYVENLPVEVKKSVEALKGVQIKQVELQNQYKRECLELEKKVSFSFLGVYQNPLSHREFAIRAFVFLVSRAAKTLVRSPICDHHWGCSTYTRGDRSW